MRFWIVLAVVLLTIGCTGKEPPTEPRPVTLCFAGDVTFDYAVKKTLAANIDPFCEVKSFIPHADLAVFNLETAITTNSVKMVKSFNFKSPPEVLSLITNAGFDIATIANNHSMDYGWAGLNETIGALKDYQIEYGGAGSNLAAASVPLYKEVNGIKIAFLFYGYVNPPSLYAGTNKPGIAPLDSVAMTKAITAARTNADFVTVIVHWGDQYEDYPNAFQTTLGHNLIDAGADLVIGHHPHVLEGIEYYGNGAIFYSIGNFVFPQWADVRMMYSALVWVVLEKKDGKVIPKYEVMPLLRDYEYYYPDITTAAEEKTIMAHWTKISKGQAVFKKGGTLGEMFYSVIK